ncbi:methylglyoxal synthase [Hathewaya proteolytica DSM 3090]|uniref:Methylglyoxal synthase n=1 Tax=Hathewaya proteolytica DSM 3090 TaxID=1121331 RepID=A0A1M6P768_9CLOT|nr:methylglyoxal synthase [Hathewaya proteolytica]SHK03716.1 methylglyoxal synthase [Hathewaya proteolytica DSM 3090]
MNNITRKIEAKKNIALVAHDHKKQELLEWSEENKEMLKRHNLFATGTTGKIISETTGLNITAFKSGPLGGDQQLGATIVNFDLDMLVFFWDPLESQPHDPDVKALLRIATLYNIPCAMNKSTADFLFHSNLMDESYNISLNDHIEYTTRHIDLK